jgi:hypothetical protein
MGALPPAAANRLPYTLKGWFNKGWVVLNEQTPTGGGKSYSGVRHRFELRLSHDDGRQASGQDRWTRLWLSSSARRST